MLIQVPQEEEPGTNRVAVIDAVKRFNTFSMAGNQLVEPQKQYYDLSLPVVINRDAREEEPAGT